MENHFNNSSQNRCIYRYLPGCAGDTNDGDGAAGDTNEGGDTLNSDSQEAKERCDRRIGGLSGALAALGTASVALVGGRSCGGSKGGRSTEDKSSEGFELHVRDMSF